MKKCFFILLSVFLLCGCSSDDISVSIPESHEISAETSKEEVYSYTPKEGNKMKGVWISQYDLQDVWFGENGQNEKDVFQSGIEDVCRNLINKGYTDIFVQIRPFGDSFYPSTIFPPSAYAVGAYGNDFSYDGVKLFIDIAHSYGLKFHAWINPFRLVKTNEVNLLSDNSEITRYIKSGKAAVWGDRYYFLPSDTEAKSIIIRGIKEVLNKYDVDGIHFDDYFYPTKETSFDSEDFMESQAKQLFDWRRNNVSEFIKEVYSVVKRTKPRCLFGVSPSGNMDYTFSTGCADIYKWCSEQGYIDYIMPQIYFGYNHPDAPFLRTLSEWQRIIKTPSVRLYVGLAAYKQGQIDTNAGEAKEEWITDTQMLSKQQKDCLLKTDGFVLFSYGYIN